MDTWDGIVSLFIACIELILLINLLIFAEKNKLNKIAMVMVAVLMVYQALEFVMCNLELKDSLFPYLAFVVITFLPPLNLLLILTLFNLRKYLFYIFLIIGLGFILYYTLTITEFAVTSCTVLYAAYYYPLGDFYGAFYYTPIIISIFYLIKGLKASPVKKLVTILLFGNIFISIPVIVGFILMFAGETELINKIESVMCKFAFVYALCLTLVCLYNTGGKHERNNPEHIPDD